jgi:hypothetical protein
MKNNKTNEQKTNKNRTRYVFDKERGIYNVLIVSRDPARDSTL